MGIKFVRGWAPELAWIPPGILDTLLACCKQRSQQAGHPHGIAHVRVQDLAHALQTTQGHICPTQGAPAAHPASCSLEIKGFGICFQWANAGILQG